MKRLTKQGTTAVPIGLAKKEHEVLDQAGYNGGPNRLVQILSSSALDGCPQHPRIPPWSASAQSHSGVHAKKRPCWQAYFSTLQPQATSAPHSKTDLQGAERLLPSHQPAAVQAPTLPQKEDAAGVGSDAAAAAHGRPAREGSEVGRRGGRVEALHLQHQRPKAKGRLGESPHKQVHTLLQCQSLMGAGPGSSGAASS